MRIEKFVPSCCEGEAPSHEGSLVYRRLNAIEKLEFVEEWGDRRETENRREQIKLTKEMMKKAIGFIEKVEMKNKETGEEILTVDDLLYDNCAQGVLSELAAILMTGKPQKKMI